MFVDLWIFAPLYGGAALVIREVTRRTGRGWTTIILLSSAFGILQSGLVDHSLFNPSYQTADPWQGMPNPTYIPVLGISALTALEFVLGHVIWSISAPIAVVEFFVPHRRTMQWLGNLGFAIVIVLYLLASAIIFWGTAEEDQFLPSIPQMLGSVLVAVVLIGIAFSIRWQSRPRNNRPVPKPWIVGTAAFAVLSLPTFIELVIGLLGVSSMFMRGWSGVATNIMLVGWLVILIWRWSQSKDWSAAHIFALAGGALLTRAWIAFLVEPFGDVTIYDKLISNTVFFLGVVVLLIIAVLKNRTYNKESET